VWYDSPESLPLKYEYLDGFSGFGMCGAAVCFADRLPHLASGAEV
jgi:hypothetical protein